MKTVWLITIATSLLQTVHCAPSAPTNSKSTAAADRPQSPARLKEIAQQKEIQAQLDAYDAFNTKMNVIALVVGGIVTGGAKILHVKTQNWYTNQLGMEHGDGAMIHRKKNYFGLIIADTEVEGGVIRPPRQPSANLAKQMTTKMNGVGFVYALGLAFILVAVFRLVQGAVKDKPTVPEAKKDPFMPHGRTLEELKTEACVTMNKWGDAADGAGEDEHGVEGWKRHWNNFESVFDSAQDVAHAKVLANLSASPIIAWPLLVSFPELADNSTVEQQFIFNQQFQLWSHKNMLTIPRMKHDIASKYYNMHRDETMEAVWRQNDHPAFVDDPDLFEQLSRTFSFRIGLPTYCLDHFKEPRPVSMKMKNLRRNDQMRKTTTESALDTRFDLIDVATRKKYL